MAELAHAEALNPGLRPTMKNGTSQMLAQWPSTSVEMVNGICTTGAKWQLIPYVVSAIVAHMLLFA